MVYADNMTLSARNSFFMGAIVFSAVSLGLVLAGGYYGFSVFHAAAAEASLRSQGILQFFAVRLAEASAVVPFWTILCSVTYSLISIILIYYFFENTQSPEILFFVIFILTFSLEFVRILLPLQKVFPFFSTYIMSASRLLFFGRFFGLFSLFAAAVYASGLNVQKQRVIFLIMAVTSLYFAMNIPFDSLVWDSTFVLSGSYNTMFSLAGAGILIISTITFFIAAYTRGSRNYNTIGIGVFLAFMGRNILFSSDNWITPIPGLILLVIGTWFTCTRLHREYLWS